MPDETTAPPASAPVSAPGSAPLAPVSAAASGLAPLGSEATFAREVLAGIFGQGAEALLGRPGDEAAARVRLRAGETLFRAGDEADAMYALVYGRLEVWVEDARGRETVVGQVAPGETVGEMGILTGDARTASVRAARESVLVRIPAAAFRAVSRSDPAMLGSILRIMAGRLHRSYDARPHRKRSTVTALIPLSAAAARTGFGERLAAGLGAFGSVARSEATVYPALASAEIEHFGRLEGAHDFVLLDCGFGDLPAAGWAVRHADRIVLYADAAGDPRPDVFERRAMGLAERPGRQAPDVTLALVHPPGARAPRGTRRWLEGRAVTRHMHLREGDGGDLARLTRFLAGRAVALVLGGGGARGYSYVGICRALEELGVPVDAVCGTSMGALVGGAVALGLPAAAMDAQSRRMNARDPFADYTLPLLSMIRGDRLARAIRDALGDGDIEDCWRSYFCVSSSLTRADAYVHRTGPLWRAIRASMGMPGIMPPVLADGELLVDGGIVNNFPADILAREMPALVIGASASVHEERKVEGEAYPSAWRWAWDRWVRRTKGPRAPTMFDIVAQTTTLASYRKQLEDAAAVDVMLRPAVAGYSMMDLGRYDAIVEAGYRCAIEHADALRALAARAQGDARGDARGDVRGDGRAEAGA